MKLNSKHSDDSKTRIGATVATHAYRKRLMRKLDEDATVCVHAQAPPLWAHGDDPTSLLCAPCFDATLRVREQVAREDGPGPCEVCTKRDPLPFPTVLQLGQGNMSVFVFSRMCNLCSKAYLRIVTMEADAKALEVEG
jgi:hypothetical protein